MTWAKYATASTASSAAAEWSGSEPSNAASLGSAPRLHSTRAQSAWPCAAAS